MGRQRDFEAMTLTPEEKYSVSTHRGDHSIRNVINTSTITGFRPSSQGGKTRHNDALEEFVLRLGMCFRAYHEDVWVLKTVFPEDMPDFLFAGGLDACFGELQRLGLLAPAEGEGASPAYVVPVDVLDRLDNSKRERNNLSLDQYRAQRKKDHAALAEALLSAQVSVTRRRRYQAEALVQFRKAEMWGRLEEMVEALSVHLFGTHDSYIGRACIDMPEQVVRRHPSFAIATAIAQASAVIDVSHRYLDDSFEQLRAAPFGEIESRIDRLIAFYGSKWVDRQKIDGKLFFGIQWMRHHRQRGDIAAAREIMRHLTSLVPEHAAQSDFPTESNLHWLENERGVLEFMAANWPAAYKHHKKVIDMTFGSAVPGQYIPRLACTVAALQQVLNGNKNKAENLMKMTVSLLDEDGDQDYIEFTLQLAQLVLCLDELDFKRAEHLATELDKRLFWYEVWGVAVRFVQLFDLLRDRHAAARARLDQVRMSGPGTHQISPLNASHLWQTQIDTYQAMGHIQRSREIYKSRPKVLAGELIGDARMQFLAGRYKPALRLSRSILNGEVATQRERGTASALIAAVYVHLRDKERAVSAVVQCLEISIKAATLLPIALLPKAVRFKIIELARTNPKWTELASSVDLSVEDIEDRIARVGQCFPDQAMLVDLTPREKVVLKMLGKEYQQAQIARQEYVALSTIKKQIGSIYRKLGVTNRDQALEVASQLGLLD